MKVWYALIVIVCLLIVSSFVFSIEPKTLTTKTADYLVKNNLLDYNQSPVSCNERYCSTKVVGKGFSFIIDVPIKTPTKSIKSDEVILSEIKGIINQRLNTYATNQIAREEKAKVIPRIISQEKTVVIASSVDEKGQISGLDSKATVKDACWFELLGFCIWK